MRQILALAVTVTFAAISFAQKNEIKAIEKALKSLNYAEAKSVIPKVEALLENMDDKLKAKFYFLKAKALYANGSASDEYVTMAVQSLEDLKKIESSMGKLKYTKQANEMKSGILKSLLTKANNVYNEKNFSDASKRFEDIYKLNTKDTIYLYNAAISSVQGQDFDSALNYYLQLRDLNYTGIRTDYYAVNSATSVEEAFGDKATRDFSVKTKMHNSPRDVVTASKKAEIVKNIALIYISQNQNEKALEAMADARKENPDDLGLLLSEVNIYLKTGNREKAKILIEEAILKDPNNAELQFNLGVFATENENFKAAKAYYEKAISLDPNYVDAYNNLAVLILQGENAILDKMNALGTTAADNKRYEELKLKKQKLYREAIPYLSKTLELRPASINAARTLMNIYSTLDDTNKYKEMKAIVEQIETN